MSVIVGIRLDVGEPSTEPETQILHALITHTFDQFAAALRPVAGSEADPVARLRAACRAYLAFADDHTHLYRVLFERHHATDATATAKRRRHAASAVDRMVGADAFGVLLDAVASCVASGASAATSPQEAATRLWVGLHGLATLRASMPSSRGRRSTANSTISPTGSWNFSMLGKRSLRQHAQRAPQQPAEPSHRRPQATPRGL